MLCSTTLSPAGVGRVRLLVSRPMLTLTVLRRAITQYRQAGNAVVKPLGYFAEACVVRRLLNVMRIEHLHVHMGTNAAAVAQIVRWLEGPDYTLTLHGPEEFDQPERLCLRREASRCTLRRVRLEGTLRPIASDLSCGPPRRSIWCDAVSMPDLACTA